MARYISSSASRLSLASPYRAYATSTSSPAVQAGLADLESTPLEESAKVDESLVQSFNERKTASKAQYLPGNR